MRARVVGGTVEGTDARKKAPAMHGEREISLSSADFLAVSGGLYGTTEYGETMTRIVVVDNHGQFTHLEGRALRDLGIDSDIVDNETPPSEVDADGFVLSGGPDMDRAGRSAEYLETGKPVLGICLGMQLMATELGGAVGSGDYGGYADVTVRIEDPDDPLVGSLAPETRVWASHADEVKELPEGFVRTGTSDVCGIESMSDTDRDLYGVQWHPEVAHTEEGEAVFENFRAVCERASDA
jgi:GMP synthase (glutamine-hydrolysing)